MNYYKTVIQYDGTHYAGFQWQNGVETIQSAINATLQSLLKGKVTTSAASRTDTGVHAFAQVVRICSETPIDVMNFIAAFNRQLPADIRCLSIEQCEGSFIPSVGAFSKEYRYFFTNQSRVSTCDSRFVANIANPLNIDAMVFCAKQLVGEHDFINFCSSGSNVKSTIRTIDCCEISKIDPHSIFKKHQLFLIPSDLQQCYQLKISGKGFLKQMVRHIVRGLWMVGSGKIPEENFGTLLNGPKVETQLWKVAPANGLFLYHINY